MYLRVAAYQLTHPSRTSSFRISYKPGFSVGENQLKFGGENITMFSQKFVTSDLIQNRTLEST
jgi:hypothetical protein